MYYILVKKGRIKNVTRWVCSRRFSENEMSDPLSASQALLDIS
jgi:hypothetical protein